MDENTFQYSYSGQERSEVEQIRRKYAPAEESKLEQLRRLDRGATSRAQTLALTLGILGALTMGTGMSLVMTELGSFLGTAAMAVGIGAGGLGIVMVALAYPLYERVLKKERAKIAPQILRLTEELMK